MSSTTSGDRPRILGMMMEVGKRSEECVRFGQSASESGLQMRNEAVDGGRRFHSPSTPDLFLLDAVFKDTRSYSKRNLIMRRSIWLGNGILQVHSAPLVSNNPSRIVCTLEAQMRWLSDPTREALTLGLNAHLAVHAGVQAG